MGNLKISTNSKRALKEVKSDYFTRKNITRDWFRQIRVFFDYIKMTTVSNKEKKEKHNKKRRFGFPHGLVC